MNVYKTCPEISSDRFLLRLVSERDCDDLLRVYSDPASVPPSYEWFGCERIATKAKPIARERIEALTAMGFLPSNEPLIGHDGTAYADYFVLTKG